MPNRLLIMKAHALIAAFIFPAACMFAITGALYSWGVKGSYTTETYNIDLTEPLQQEVNTLVDLTETELAKLELSTPTGKAKIKTAGQHFMLEWTGSDKDIILEPAATALTAKLTVKHTSWYRSFVQLHKAKGGPLFKVYAVIFAISIAFLLASGLIMAWQTPKLKQMTIVTFLLGVGAFFGFFMLS